QQTGMAGQLTVSGLHIAMLGGVVYWLCRLARLRPRWSLAITGAFLGLYAAVALPSHSGARAVLLFAAAALATTTHRPTDRVQLLALAALAMLVWHPLDLFSGGFQFSFAAVLALILFLPR